MTMDSTNKNLVQVFCGVRGYEEDGVAYLHIEDSARGLGFEREKNGAMYVMWDRVEQYLADLSFHTCVESGNPKMLLPLLKRKELDSKTFTNDEIIFDDFGSKNPLPLNNRGQVFVSLSGFLEILSKTELSSDKVDDFQEEIFGRVLPQRIQNRLKEKARVYQIW